MQQLLITLQAKHALEHKYLCLAGTNNLLQSLTNASQFLHRVHPKSVSDNCLPGVLLIRLLLQIWYSNVCQNLLWESRHPLENYWLRMREADYLLPVPRAPEALHLNQYLQQSVIFTDTWHHYHKELSCNLAMNFHILFSHARNYVT